MCPLVCKLLAVMYSNIEAEVNWNDWSSDKFNISNGVKQGGVISPLLFNLYVENLILRIIDSGFGCYVGDVCASILMYADDIALLAPTRYAMQKLLDICSNFGIEFSLSFNADKSESVFFGDMSNIALNFHMDGKLIPIVNKINYLGHHLQNNSGHKNIFNVNPLVSDIKTRTNVILSYFNFLTTDSKIQTFNTNCNSYYGCVLANQTDRSLDVLDCTWRVCSRKILYLPSRTHCNIIPHLMGTLPPSKQINQRTVSFFINGLNHNTNFVKYFFNHCLVSESSTMYKNLRRIAYNLDITLDSLLTLSKTKMKKIMNVEINWRANMIRELIQFRDKKLISNLNKFELDRLMIYLCTK